MEVSFLAGIDDEGCLTLAIDPIVPARAAMPFIPRDEPLQNQTMLCLSGTSEDGWRFESGSASLSGWSHPEGRVEIEADCGLAEFSRAVAPDHRDMRAWNFRKLRTYRGIERQTDLGRFVFVSYRDTVDQQPSAVLAIHAGAQMGQEWWDESERFLIHLERTLSFACDAYLVPIYEQRVRGGVLTYRVVRRGRSSHPYMPPFDSLFMEQILGCAIRSFRERPEALERLDPAIRWITAPVAYEESRLINAMSALESILALSGLPDLFMADRNEFGELKKEVRRFLKRLKAPSRMGGKVDELNRRSFRDKLEDLIKDRSIVTADFPDNWMRAIIDARNTIVHTGVAPDLPASDARLLDHIVWAREIVTRIILQAIGFEGQFQSWLHRSQYLSFPGCRPMSEVAASGDGALSEAPE
ncbi:hypothetical protein M2337_002439 [Sphingobium sp. B2D3A]|uniref:HEPN domain-containing protein n=1 Tax=unclassified Sphingobium TaxID=2611147 RepID=UPI0022250833|nr:MULTISPECIES: HEPN domain-containing protein [unclassified Sphingobium]MCW2338206.1 hypothetical protein [Sphingobium sp. B2D3A]MCW2384665.1 hypothetical protein [Sphingobium sp. B2D3D]